MVWNQNEIKAAEEALRSSEMKIKALDDEIVALEGELECDKQLALREAIKTSEATITALDDEIRVLEAELKALAARPSQRKVRTSWQTVHCTRTSCRVRSSKASSLQLKTLRAQVPVKDQEKKLDEQPVIPSNVSTSLSKTLCASSPVKDQAKKPKEQEVTSECRFQGKIKHKRRDMDKFMTLTLIKSRKVSFGWIQVKPNHLKKLHELHPLWTAGLQKDVFFHTSDCCYEGQYEGDLVTFRVCLHPHRTALQARDVKLESRREHWHEPAFHGE